MTTKARYTEHGAEFVESFELRAGAPDADLAEARATIDRLLAPAPRNEILKSLGVLKVLTARRPEDDNDLRLQIVTYAELLAEWPADVVRYVIATQATVSKWWPTWVEIRDRLEYYAHRRRAIARALKVAP